MRTMKIVLSTLLIVMITIMCMFSVNYSPGVTNDTGQTISDNLKNAATQIPIDVALTMTLLAGLIYMKRYRMRNEYARTSKNKNDLNIHERLLNSLILWIKPNNKT